MAFLLFFAVTILIPLAVFLLVLFTNHLFPNFFRFKLKRFLNGAVCGVGFLTPLALFMIWATTHDIYGDYLSAPLFARFKTALPGWYVWDVHSCHGEWSVLGVSFFLIILFHILLFARFVVNWANAESSNTSTSQAAERDS
jgi:hypothetical protein